MSKLNFTRTLLRFLNTLIIIIIPFTEKSLADVTIAIAGDGRGAIEKSNNPETIELSIKVSNIPIEDANLGTDREYLLQRLKLSLASYEDEDNTIIRYSEFEENNNLPGYYTNIIGDPTNVESSTGLTYSLTAQFIIYMQDNASNTIKNMLLNNSIIIRVHWTEIEEGSDTITEDLTIYVSPRVASTSPELTSAGIHKGISISINWSSTINTNESNASGVTTTVTPKKAKVWIFELGESPSGGRNLSNFKAYNFDLTAIESDSVCSITTAQVGATDNWTCTVENCTNTVTSGTDAATSYSYTTGQYLDDSNDPPAENTQEITVIDNNITFKEAATLDSTQSGTTVNKLEANKYYLVLSSYKPQGIGLACSIAQPTTNWTLSELMGADEATPSDPSCFIATAAWGTPFNQHLDLLRWFRDEWLNQSELGKSFIDFYYENSPALASSIANSSWQRTLVRSLLIPIVFLISILKSKMAMVMTAMTLLLITAIAISLQQRSRLRFLKVRRNKDT